MYVFAHYLKKSIKEGKPIWPSIRLLPITIYYNMGKKFLIDWELPWIAIGAVNEIKKNLHAEMRIFEYGSGGSTLFFAKRVKKVVSVEHHPAWYSIVKKKLEDKNISKVSLELVEPSKGLNENSNHYKSYVEEEEYADFDFYNYVHAIDQYKCEYFDLILIDGRARPKCLQVSISKLKNGGMLVFDNADRKNYKEAIKRNLHDWKVNKHYGPTVADPAFTETHIYYKP